MAISVKQIMQNPSGKYSAYFGRRSDIISNMESRFSKMIASKKDFKCEFYKRDKDYFYVMKVPSETYDDFYFDVVIQATPASDAFATDYSINNYQIKLFSNSPNFVFTYAYVYDKTDTLIDFLRDKIEEIALDEEPKVRNPIQSYGYEKSVYFALLWIKANKYDTKSVIESKCKELDIESIKENITHSSATLKKYNINKNKVNAEKEKNRVLDKKKSQVRKIRKTAEKKPERKVVKLTGKRGK